MPGSVEATETLIDKVQNPNLFSNILDKLLLTDSSATTGTAGGGGVNLQGLDILLIVLFILLILGVGIYQYLVFKKKEKVSQRKGVLFQIRPGLEITYKKGEKKVRMTRLLETFAASVGGFWQTLQIVEPTYSFEIHANGIGGYGTYIWVPEEEVQHLPAKMRSLYEQPLLVKEEEEPMQTLYNKISGDDGYAKIEGFFTAEYQMGAPPYLPLKEWLPEKGEPDDPMEQIFGIFDGLRGNHIAGLILTIKPTNMKWKEEGTRALQELQFDMPKKGGFFSFLKPGAAPEEQTIKKRQMDAFQKDQVRHMTAKLKEDGMAAVVRIYSSDETTFQLLSNAIEKRFKSDYNQLVKTSDRVSLEELKIRWFEKSNMVLSLTEAASVFHFADSETRAERLQRGGSSTAAPDENLAIVSDDDGSDPFSIVQGL